MANAITRSRADFAGLFRSGGDLVDPNAVPARLVGYLLFAAGGVTFHLFPIWAGAYVDLFGFSAQQVGTLLAVEALANTLAAVTALFWIRKCNWRLTFLSLIGVNLSANFACVFAGSYDAFFILRMTAGACAGAMMTFAYVTFASSPRPDREFGFGLALHLAFGAAILFSVSTLMRIGFGTLFGVVGAVVLLPAFLVHALPRRYPLKDMPEEKFLSVLRISATAVVGLVAVTLFWAYLNAFWSFVERVGDGRAFSLEFISRVMSIGLFFSFCGSMVPALFSDRLNRRYALSGAYAVLLAALALIILNEGPVAFTAALFAYYFFHSLVLPIQSGWTAGIDDTGRTAVILPIAQGLGIALGPLLAGLVIAGEQFVRAIYLSAALLVVSFIFQASFFVRARAQPGEATR